MKFSQKLRVVGVGAEWRIEFTNHKGDWVRLPGGETYKTKEEAERTVAQWHVNATRVGCPYSF